MLDVQRLAETLVSHTRQCRSAQIVCSEKIAVESWFRVELVPALIDYGISRSDISFDFTYPGTQRKADLQIRTPEMIAVLELKCFVEGADARKVHDFPNQLQRLRHLTEKGIAAQAIAFCTFVGYLPKRLDGYISDFFPSPWITTRPRPIIDETRLRFIFASFGG